jgi:hypothetical protein
MIPGRTKGFLSIMLRPKLLRFGFRGTSCDLVALTVTFLGGGGGGGAW